MSRTASWLAFFAFGINFGLTYLIYGLPFFLMAGRLREVLALQAVLAVLLALLYVPAGRSLPLEWIYTPVSLGLWAGCAVAFSVATSRVLAARPVNRHG